MNRDRLTVKLFNYFRKLSVFNTWFKTTDKDIEKLRIIQEDIKNAQGFQENPKKRADAMWTDERRERHRSKMKEIWERRKR